MQQLIPSARTNWHRQCSCLRPVWKRHWKTCAPVTSGLCLLHLDTRWQLSTKAEWADCIRRLLDARRAVPLGPAAMETLTVIAYNQPVSRAFIEQVRGVDSSSSVTSLLEKGLIEEAGRLDLPGRPVSFRTTDVFLRCFGLSSLADLPPVHSAEDETTKTEEANE